MSEVTPQMLTQLSPREAEIVELAIEGLTNEGIAHKLGISFGTVNTYWLRIRLKVGGIGRTDSVAKVISERAETALRAANRDRLELSDLIAEKEHALVDIRASLALLQLAMEQIQSTVWATDTGLILKIVANGEMPRTHFGVAWEAGKTIYEIFKSDDPTYPPIAAHLAALDGHESALRLTGEFTNMMLRALPLYGETGEISGCIGIMNYTAETK